MRDTRADHDHITRTQWPIDGILNGVTAPFSRGHFSLAGNSRSRPEDAFTGPDDRDVAPLPVDLSQARLLPRRRKILVNIIWQEAGDRSGAGSSTSCGRVDLCRRREPNFWP